MPAVRLDNLTKRFGSSVAVDGFALHVAHGEAVAILGPSGCGKSTVMRMIAGIVDPDEGVIEIGGRIVNDAPPERRNVGLVFQSYALFPHLTVEGNVGFGLRMRGVRRAEARARVASALELVELAALGGRYPRQLSGGQQQRVALARALVIEPDVLLLDEPLSNLDALLREQLREDIKLLQRRLGVTMLYVTHDQVEALALADRVVVMAEGRVQEIGAPIDLYRRPARRFTAEFLGQTNIIPGVSANGAIRLPWGATVADPKPGRNGPVTISIRPEDFAVAADANGAGTVMQRAFLGRDVEYHLDLSDCRIRVRQSGSRAALLAPGMRVAVSVPPIVHTLETAA